MERYFRYEAAGDRFTGRVATGLPINSVDLSILPPHFTNAPSEFISDTIAIVFPKLVSQSHLHGALRLLLASLVYHCDFIKKMLPFNHPLLSTALFTTHGFIESLRPMLFSGLNSPHLTPTGIPPFVELLRHLKLNQEAIELLPNVILDGVREIIDERGLASGNITREYFESTLSKALSTIAAGTSSNPVPSDCSTNRPEYDVHHWNGQLHMLPIDFKFPSVDLMTAWTLWWHGNPSQKVPSFKKINTRDLSLKTERKEFYEWRHIMNQLTSFYVSKTGHEPNVHSTTADLVEAFDVCKDLLAPISDMTPKNRKRRHSQLCVSTTARLVRQMTAPGANRPFQARKKTARDGPHKDNH
ncbi:hypothetical protein Ae201684P_002905 [Aphanomyces euteiches]|uniref:Uncharacterized protein n=1 Tax=Aphanomyces euteiches TaxID=100861 RepID=A0A6G0X525_9STRA|nr:hypothetical protein Ae201684_008291 [Aphanomyces euteiches]KAH9070548.1 hypothetical protein Ae201684P_002905 [Aphanomyces euteiches]